MERSLTPQADFHSPDTSYEQPSPYSVDATKNRLLLDLHEIPGTFDSDAFSKKFLAEEEDEKSKVQGAMQEFAGLSIEFCVWMSVRMDQLREETTKSLENKVIEIHKMEHAQEQKRLLLLEAVDGINKCLDLLKQPPEETEQR